jgi:hypothetical protein
MERLGDPRVAFQREIKRRPIVQFLVYLTLLMVSISTVLLEVHWLASPEPKPKPAVQTSAPAQAPKTEGSNAGVRTVYPKSPDASRPVESDSEAQTTDTRQATGQTTPATNTPVQHPAQTTMALSAQQPEPPASVPENAPSQQPASATPLVPLQQPSPTPSSTQPAVAPRPGVQQSRAETTGAAMREENRTQAANPANPSNRADNSQQQATLGSSRNRRDILACAGAYRSFRANDCTYQPFEGGPRRLCDKSPGQRVAREREQPERRRWSRDAETGFLDRPTSGRRFVDEYDDVAADFADARRGPLGFFLFGRLPRW